MSAIHQTNGISPQDAPQATGGNDHAVHGGTAKPSGFSTQLKLALSKTAQPGGTHSPAPPNGQNSEIKPPGLQSILSAPRISSADQHQGAGHDFFERALRVLAHRQQLLASNIANADTPGYKAIDIDVREALLGEMPENAIPKKYHVPSQGSVDGNTVEMDVERTKFAQNAIVYETAVTIVKDHYMMMNSMLKDLT